MVTVDLSRQPEDPAAAKGYAELFQLWKSNSDAFQADRDIDRAAFKEWVKNVELHLDQREASFFNEPFEPQVLRLEAWFQAKAVARLYKILMDRQGFKVSKENGGLG